MVKDFENIFSPLCSPGAALWAREITVSYGN
jgi:hypothetical protein